jgi:hypothetical protein
LILHPGRIASPAMLLAIRREFGKSVDWRLTGKTHLEPKKWVGKNPANLGWELLSAVNQRDRKGRLSHLNIVTAFQEPKVMRQ